MTITRKHVIMFLLIGLLVSGIPAITTCSSSCVSSGQDLDVSTGGSCPFTLQIFAQSVFMLFPLFVLPLAGFLLTGEQIFIASDFYRLLFRPPRLSH